MKRGMTGGGRRDEEREGWMDGWKGRQGERKKEKGERRRYRKRWKGGQGRREVKGGRKMERGKGDRVLTEVKVA